MAKVTSKLQVTIPRKIADLYAISPGDEIDFVAAGDGIRIVLAGKAQPGQLGQAERLRLFHESCARQRSREKAMKLPSTRPATRGWSRAELYQRGKPR
ncbi:MAG: AbrB/MazE/SpoVT family DNA-binding domain-containing protein [Gammaproteobacteria bacterium]|nr:AbrB/MazE/SpoVT family DNA-binding domain-containing protein [Gammaproteobacteria bacterium]